MQNRMKTHGLPQEEIAKLLQNAEVAVFTTLNEDGYPYGIPVHFAYLNGKVYLHGLPIGQKNTNIEKDSRVCITVYNLGGYILPEGDEPCSTNTAYESVVMLGNAAMVQDIEVKRSALSAIVQKFTPGLSAANMPEGAIKGTGVIEITPVEVTGKYYK